MSEAKSRNPRVVLAPYADEFEAAAAEADSLEKEDVYAGLAALARGEEIPQDVAERVVERAVDQ